MRILGLIALIGLTACSEDSTTTTTITTTQDFTFGTSGITTTEINSEDQNKINKLYITSDDIIYAMGYVGSTDMAMAKYTKDGSLETTFGTDGKFTKAQTDGGFAVEGYAVKDSSLYMVGQGSSSSMAVAKMSIASGTDGTLDTTFDSDGVINWDVATTVGNTGSSTDIATAVGFDLTGQLVVIGHSNMANGGTENRSVIAKLNATTGAFASWGTSGILALQLGSGGQEWTTELSTNTSNGEITVAGSWGNGSDLDFGVARIDNSGNLVSSFGSSGKLTIDFTNNDWLEEMAVLSDGSMVLAGYTYDGSAWDLALAKVDNNGALDTSFGTDGKTTYDLNMPDATASGASSATYPPSAAQNNMHGLGINVDETNNYIHVIAVGNGINDTPNMTVLRFTSAGALDTTFADSGLSRATNSAKTAVDSGSGNPRAMAVQSDGNLIVGGENGCGSLCHFQLLRFTP